MKQKWMGALALCLVLGMAQAEAPVDMLAVDHELYELGYRDAACNGILDDVTINALRNFQLANDLETTGEPDQETVKLLLEGDGVRQADYLEALAQQNSDAASLEWGDDGSAVKQLQRALKELGYFSGDADGAFGRATTAAVCRFQLANGLEQTGIADGAVQLRLYEGEPVVWEDFLLDSCASVGDSGAHVRTLQLWLRRRGYFQGACTGRYGDGTQQAVKRFQNENGLEASGDVDLETSRALFANAVDLLPGNAPLRPGDAGEAAAALCRSLSALDYPAGAQFDTQTELALMLFQQAGKLEITGVADAETLELLHSDKAPRFGKENPAGLEAIDGESLNRIARRASALLGQTARFDDAFGFAQYVYLKCGVPLLDVEQLSPVRLGAADAIEAGSVLEVQLNGKQICGIATSDRAVIYCADSGYIVMSYLDSMRAEGMWLHRPAA